jgi:hypothetical protein
MNTQTRRAALRAARKLSLGTLALGAVTACGGQVWDGSSRPDEELVVDDGGGSASASGDQCSPPIELPEQGMRGSNVPRDDALCCGAYVSAAIEQSTMARSFVDDPGFVNCCKVLIADSEGPDPTFGFQGAPGRDSCCFGGVVAPATELYGYALCTPWGPPVPPELDPEVLA